MAKKSKTRTLFDIEIEVPCPQCGNPVKILPSRVDRTPLEAICRPCALQFRVNEEQIRRAMAEHTDKLAALERSLRPR